MSGWDLAILVGFFVFMVADGLRKRRGLSTSADFLLASRSAPWWASGLSIMATQASAVTMVGTTGLGFESGTAFVQYYYFLPFAMVVLCLTAVPHFHRLQVYTAYEYLEHRFGRGTRTLAAATFLVLRCLSLGVILAAPAHVLATFTGAPFSAMVAAMGAAAVAYTSIGGLRAVIATDVKQMVVMVVALVGLFAFVLSRISDHIPLGSAWDIADAAGRIVLWDTSFDPKTKYTVWSALLGGTIVFLAYFGTDQSQVQRYLANRSLTDQRKALMVSAVFKIPFQLMILFLGVGLWLMATLDPTTPAALDPDEHARLEQEDPQHFLRTGYSHAASGLAARTEAFAKNPTDQNRAQFREALSVQEAARADLRKRLSADGTAPSEANAVLPWFMRHRLPTYGLVGLLLAGILAAALSSIDSELNSLATVATLDGLRLNPEDPTTAGTIVSWTRRFTVMFGLLATGFALTLRNTAALVEKVNAVGSWFYGALLGVFLLAWFDRRATGRSAVGGLCAGIAAVAALEMSDQAAWLWKNTVGTGACVLVGILLARLLPERRAPAGRPI